MKKMASQKMLKTRDRAIRYSMYDFIEAVQAQPQIWARQNADYHNRDKREKAWQEVARRLHVKFDVMPFAEKQKTVMMLTKRWKNTRDSFFRAERRSRLLKERDEAKPYIYEKEMRFLAPTGGEHDDDKEMETNIFMKVVANAEEKKPKKSDEVVAAATIKTEKKKRSASKATKLRKRRAPADAAAAAAPTTPDTTTNDAVEQHPPRTAVAAKVSRMVSLSSAAASKNELVESSCSALAENLSGAEWDPDQSFFDSIKPVVRDMNTDQRLDFQIAVLNLIKEFRGRQ